MKVEKWLFMAGVVFFTPIGIVYGIMTHWNEPMGPVGLFLSAGLSGLIGAYLWVTAKHIDARPEDDAYGEIAQGAGELGLFPPYSWQPLLAASGAAVLFAGLAVGWWLFFIGVGVGAIGLVGWVFEYYVGEHAH